MGASEGQIGKYATIIQYFDMLLIKLKGAYVKDGVAAAIPFLIVLTVAG